MIASVDFNTYIHSPVESSIMSSATDKPEAAPSTLRWMNADGRRVVMARAIRSFGYGFTSILLGVTLNSAGFSTIQIGLILTAALVGDIIAIILVALFADRIGRRRVLVFLALLMVGSGLAFAFSRNLFVLLLAAFFGTLSPSSADNAPFAAIEQAILPQTCPQQRRMDAFARYNLMAQLAGAAGGLAVVIPDILHRTMGMDTAFAARAMFAGYAVIALAMGTLFLSMSDKIESTSASPHPIEPVMIKAGKPLQKSRGIVLRLASLFALDAFAGGLVVQTILSLWFHLRFGVPLSVLGGLFFGTNLLAALFLLARQSLSQMDVPTRQAYTMTMVAPEERTAAASLTTMARSIALSLSPLLAGALLSGAVLSLGLPFLLCGELKASYDLLLYGVFRRVKPPTS